MNKPLLANPSFSLFRSTTLAVLGAATLGAAFGPRAQAAPVPNLTFDISARVAAAGSEGGPKQTLQARVLLHGNRTRVETTYAGQKSVTLIAPPYIYRLLPNSKAGVRWKLEGSRAQALGGLGLDPQELIRNPGKIRELLVKAGAKRAGSGQLNGAAVDLYTLSQPKEQLSQARAWLRKSDSLPVKLEASGQGLQVTANWSNYARPQDLDANLFRAPKGYSIREAKSAPPMAMF